MQTAQKRAENNKGRSSLRYPGTKPFSTLRGEKQDSELCPVTAEQPTQIFLAQK